MKRERAMVESIYPRRCMTCGRKIQWEPEECFDCRAKAWADARARAKLRERRV